ncbi:hypothetical protein B1987_01205 [Mycobacterium kansasii]|uniref:Lincosamide resistance protein n=1 Tax=Mycobacterium attenuatum TaxID=2341086 RepID=A0A498Q2F7_9MYCO|nr:hypothetical protein [Mycobacterium attenuatum]ORB82698.1 hypothetical protein B1987_01205 [Mycobacterium kansasii]VBA39511.1 hypothetical protein LAUMK136_03035 [Mycobacterium attenuatum]
MTAYDAFDPRRIIEVLNQHNVEYVLVGGYAARLYGARRPTYDIDIAPSMELDNLQRLSAALRELGAGIRVDDLPDGLPFDCSGESLRGMRMLNLRTPVGDLDLTFAPAGYPDGYHGLLPGVQERVIDSVRVKVAALDDVIASKTAAARPKDLDALPELIDLARRDRKDKG